MVDEISVVDRNSEKLVDESSVVVQNTGLQLKGLDEKAVIDQSAFSPFELHIEIPVQLLQLVQKLLTILSFNHF